MRVKNVPVVLMALVGVGGIASAQLAFDLKSSHLTRSPSNLVVSTTSESTSQLECTRQSKEIFIAVGSGTARPQEIDHLMLANK